MALLRILGDFTAAVSARGLVLFRIRVLEGIRHSVVLRHLFCDALCQWLPSGEKVAMFVRSSKYDSRCV